MKTMIKVFGVIVFIAVISLSTATAQSAQNIGRITITEIPARYDGKFIMLTVDTGGSGARNVAWGTRTINGTSTTINLLDWVTDQPTTINAGNYGLNIILAANMSAIANDQEEFIGIIMARALSGETVSVEWGEFMDMTN
ncbi:MAG: hypothetical protein FWG77_07795 [Treponema sp.]|nr:hypothetical protein [Treponema sp.]